MKLLILLLLTFTASADDYADGYDDFNENQGEWSDSNEYLDGYEDAQNLRKQQEYERKLRQEREPVDDYRFDDYYE